MAFRSWQHCISYKIALRQKLKKLVDQYLQICKVNISHKIFISGIMAEKQDIVAEAFKDVEKSMKMKLSLIQTLESEYKHICNRTENNLKHVEELTAKIYNLEGSLNTSDCRLTKYRKNEAEWEKDTLTLKANADGVKESLEETRRSAHSDDIQFDQNVFKLVEQNRKDRLLFDSNSSKESLLKLESMERTLVQETLDVKNILKEEKKKHLFTDSKEVTSILKNTDLSFFIHGEIKNLLSIKDNLLKGLEDLKEVEMTLEEEIAKLNKTA